MSKAQIVILGQSFLDWIYTHPHSNIGNFFKDSTKVIGLLLGINKDHVKAEHRAELLTFAVWKFLLSIKPNDHDHLSTSLVKAVSSIMPNQVPYIMPRPMRKFRVWPQPVQEETLLLLNEKITHLDKIQVSVEVFEDSNTLDFKVMLDNQDVFLINEMCIQVKMPQISRGSLVKFKLETSKIFEFEFDLFFQV